MWIISKVYLKLFQKLSELCKFMQITLNFNNVNDTLTGHVTKFNMAISPLFYNYFVRAIEEYKKICRNIKIILTNRTYHNLNRTRDWCNQSKWNRKHIVTSCHIRLPKSLSLLYRISKQHIAKHCLKFWTEDNRFWLKCDQPSCFWMDSPDFLQYVPRSRASPIFKNIPPWRFLDNLKKIVAETSIQKFLLRSVDML